MRTLEELTATAETVESAPNPIDRTLDGMRFIADCLAHVSIDAASGSFGIGSSAGARQGFVQTYDAIRLFVAQHIDVEFPEERIPELDAVIEKFERAITDFEIAASEIISKYEQHEMEK
jgi:hypothetical protein